MDQYQEVYRQEAEELLTDLEEALLELEECPDDLDIVARAFRSMHTIKGSGAMFGFDNIAAFTHELETVFDRVRNGELKVSSALVDVGLKSKDHIRGLLSGGAAPADGQLLLDRLHDLVGPAGKAPSTPATPTRSQGASPEKNAEDSEGTFRVRFMPRPELFESGTNPVLLLDELRNLGSCHVKAITAGIPLLDELDPQECRIGWDVVLTTAQGENAIHDVFIFVEDLAEIKVQLVDEGASGDPDGDYKKLGDILVERGDLTKEQMAEALKEQKRFGEILKEKGVVPPEKVESALTEQQTVREVRKQREAAESSMSIRVPALKLDALVDLVGELVIAQARLSQTSARRADTEFLAIAEEVERLTAELRDNTLNIRMLPIGSTFGRFRRLVRDLSAELGKQVDLVTEGAETELDKTVIERLGDPLVHLIRNSIDHGIQMPEERAAQGKPPKGTVRLKAAHSGATVIIQISDDGAGLDSAAIRSKAVERGLIPDDAKLPEKDLYNLILLPGFSTAKQVSSVSGRGVGMDVVKRSIEALRGTVEISSAPDAGTMVTITLPLTLAIIEGLLVQVGPESFVLPLSIVEECVELTREDVRNSHGRRMSPVRGELVPYIRLREWFAMAGETAEIEQIVITSVDGQRFGFVVDKVIGQHQTVIKNLGKAYQHVEGMSGATILGDGTVALIIDVPKLLQCAEAEESHSTH